MPLGTSLIGTVQNLGRGDLLGAFDAATESRGAIPWETNSGPDAVGSGGYAAPVYQPSGGGGSGSGIPWVKIGLGVVALIAVNAFAQGFGEGIAG